MAGTERASKFGLSRLQLAELMAVGGREGAGRVAELGGVEAIADHLGSNTEAGISRDPAELKARKREFGKNSIPSAPSKSFLSYVFDVLQNKTLIILIIAAFVSLVLGVTLEEQKNIAWIEGATILIAIFIVVMVIAIYEWNKERQILGQQEADATFSVLREKKVLELPLAELVVGDIVKFDHGNDLPVDGILVQGFDVKMDEAAMSGEAELIRKSADRDPMLYSGTQVKEGSGTMLVTAVGVHSRKGMIFSLLTSQEEKSCCTCTQLLDKIRGFCSWCVQCDIKCGDGESTSLDIKIKYIGMGAAVLCILVLVLRYVIEEFGVDGRSWDSSRDFPELLHFVTIGIVVLVVAIPEGLPLATAMALGLSVKKMLKDNNVVRRLDACVAMGSATTIWADKTGTLTTNRMTVVESYFAGTKYDVTPRPIDLPENLVEVLKLGIAVNSSYSSKLTAGSQPTSSGGHLGPGPAKQVGNVTECAMLHFLLELGIDYETVREDYPVEVLKKVFTFNSQRKRMSTVIELPGGGYRVLTKGAPDIVLDKCTHILGKNGRVNPLSSVEHGALKAIVQSMASNALMTICIAYRDIPATGSSDVLAVIDWDSDCEETVVTDLTCVGFVGIQDPVRPEVPSSIQQCQEAGITVCLMTGDFPATARAVAEKCGIITKGKGKRDLVLEGSGFNRRIRDAEGEISQEKLDRVWPRLRVLARCTPTDKHTLVNGIIVSQRRSRQVVAVIGDGTNDAPALNRADVGVAMGIAGTDVAKEASSIVLGDDNFASVVKAVKWGRNVYDSISKFIQFQLTVNIVAVTLVIISAFTIGDSPLRPIQLLWVDLIMDILASVALAIENPTDALLKQKPYDRTQSLISRNMWTFILGHSLYQLVIMFVLVYAGPELFDIDGGAHRELRADPTEHFTLIFNAFVLLQIFNEFNARKVHGEFNVFTGIFSNFIFLGVIVGQVGVQALIVEFGSVVFSTSGLSADLWLWCLFLGSTSLLWGQILIVIVMPLINKIPKKKEPVDVTDNDEKQMRVMHESHAGPEQSHRIHLDQPPQPSAMPRGHQYVPTLQGKETTV